MKQWRNDLQYNEKIFIPIQVPLQFPTLWEGTSKSSTACAVWTPQQITATNAKMKKFRVRILGISKLRRNWASKYAKRRPVRIEFDNSTIENQNDKKISQTIFHKHTKNSLHTSLAPTRTKHRRSIMWCVPIRLNYGRIINLLLMLKCALHGFITTFHFTLFDVVIARRFTRTDVFRGGTGFTIKLYFWIFIFCGEILEFSI